MEFSEPSQAQRFFAERLIAGDYDGVIIGMLTKVDGEMTAQIWYDNKVHFVSLIGLAEGLRNDLYKSWNTPADEGGEAA